MITPVESSDKSNQLLQSRRSVLRQASILSGLLIGTAGSRVVRGQTGTIPTQAVYEIQITGATAHEQFTRSGQLFLLPPLDISGVNFDNGQNPRDIAIISGNPSATPEPGAIWFATNNGAFDQAGLQTTTGDALIDVVFMESDEDAGRLDITLDPNATRTVQLNTMNSRGGLTANVYHILEGSASFQFTDGGERVGATIDFVGDGFIEPGPSPYQATVDGVVIST
jgi:hypothetical protein